MKKLIIYGIHPLIEAITSDYNIKKIFILKKLQKQFLYFNNKSNSYKKLINLSKKKKIPIHSVSEHHFLPIKNKNHQGIFSIISHINTFKIKELLPNLYKKKINPFLIILDNITDVRNFGSIVRTSVCAGVNAIIVPNKNTAMINSDSIKTSSGALFKIPICKENSIINSIKFLTNSGLKIVSTTIKSTVNWHNINFLKPTAIIFGNEEKGVNEKYIEISNKIISIPSIHKNISSLNVSVACGIILYEVFRQRKTLKN
ncbi:23S rRNA (guanosine(2251)-2'-O)-methyltransferase RlmB [Blattabacterium cuenoti]|uniref:23S rRNA (guanosine(2251)-2'-O)-methyltransferase RlmB n=1 Tax=Blattabacterium cuenoti TaxID=1653831 RepID=UPI00163C6A3C|nr:23S rRNA (guanosine(2251)-2'-O)-methyltransferase RlmB [Blattabacterium cuenoti]